MQIEFAVLDALDKGIPFRGSEREFRAVWIFGIAHKVKYVLGGLMRSD
jgi:hypothetical protein